MTSAPDDRSTKRLQRLRWLLLRAARMSVPELAHRVREQMRHAADSRQNDAWESFADLDTSFIPIAGFQPDVRVVPTALESAIASVAQDARNGGFNLLNQRWPTTTADQSWLLDPVSGTSWPGADVPASRVAYRHEHSKGDVKFVWELNRLQALPALALDNPETAASDIAALLRSWMRINPPSRGINWTNGIEAASRLVSVLVAHSALRECRQALPAPLGAFVEAHLRFIERFPSLHSSANNHRVAELAALFITASCLPKLPDAESRAAKARAGLETEILRQFHSDGIGAEQSPTYAAYSLEWFALAGIVAEDRQPPFSATYRDRAAAAAVALMTFGDDNGAVPLLGDDDSGRVVSIGDLPEQRYCAFVVTLVGRWLERSDLHLPSDAALRDLLCATTVQRLPAGARRAGESRTFDEGGWTVFREEHGGTSLVLIFDHAPLGFLSIAAHGHADALAVVLSVGTEPVLIDPGTYLYHGGSDQRNRLRGTMAHNTVAVAGADQSVIAGPFSWRRHARTTLVQAAQSSVTAEHDGYNRPFGIVHKRMVRKEGGGRYTILDWLDRTNGRQPVPWTLGFTLHSDIDVEIDGRCARLQTRAGHSIVLTADQPWTLQAVDMSPAFNIKRVTRRLGLQGQVAMADSAQISKIAIAVTFGNADARVTNFPTTEDRSSEHPHE